MPFFYAILAVLVGTAVGYLVQRVATALRYNGKWPETPRWKKTYISLSGSIAAFIAGLSILNTTDSFLPEQILARLWLYQTIAAWLGATAIDLMIDLWRNGKGKGGKK